VLLTAGDQNCVHGEVPMTLVSVVILVPARHRGRTGAEL
jgi:hypothetical protein